jgi:hypothetical protein
VPNPKATDAMVDIETMGLRPDAAIVAIGAVTFGENEILDRFYTPVSLQSCLDLGLTVSRSTVEWWDRQPNDVRARWDVANAPPVEAALNQFHWWLLNAIDPLTTRVWANGPDFDLVILQSAMERVQLEVPWSYFNKRCYRTARKLMSLAGDRERERIGAHDALADAVHQAWVLMGLAAQRGARLA